LPEASGAGEYGALSLFWRRPGNSNSNSTATNKPAVTGHPRKLNIRWTGMLGSDHRHVGGGGQYKVDEILWLVTDFLNAF
jgi:hypothetical protein